MRVTPAGRWWRTWAPVLVLVTLAGPLTPAVYAHHAAPTEYDFAKPMVLRGVLAKMLWANPHGWMYLDVTASDGSVTQWMVETGSPNTLLRMGWRRRDIVPGTELIIQMFPARNGKLEAHATRVTFADGRVLMAETRAPTRDGLRNPITR